MMTKDIFSGDSYRAIFAVLTYRLLSRKWVSYVDIMNDALSPQKITCSVTNCENYGELKKAFIDVRNAIKEVEGVDSIAEQGNKRFRYVGKDDDPLRNMRNAKAIKDNEYPQSSKSVNSIFEARSVSTCAEFEPFKKVEAEISPVELIAELIEIELQEVFLDIVIRVKNAALGIADGCVYPREHSADPGLVLHDISFMSGNRTVPDEC